MMAEGSKITGAEGKANILVAGKGNSMQGDEKLLVDSSGIMEVKGEIEGKKMSEHSERSMEWSMKVEKAGSISWVVEMEQMLHYTRPSVEKERWKKNSIYRVPEWHKNMSNRWAYQPSLVSLGPFHHGGADLLPMEEHKNRAVLTLLRRAGRKLGEFVAAIEEVTDELQDAYQGLDDKWRRENRERFVEMMVKDGCFMLEIMRAKVLNEDDDDYAPYDPVFSKDGVHYLFGAIRADMLVIENQIPLLALERLEAACQGATPQSSYTQSAQAINNLVRPFLGFPCVVFGLPYDLGLHILDTFHKSMCHQATYREEIEAHREKRHQPHRKERYQMDVMIPSAIELNKARVHFKKSPFKNNSTWVEDLKFKNGVLTMPMVMVDNHTEKQFLNLIVFEQLYADDGSDITNYIFLMDQIINSERDVKFLRSQGIIINHLGSDKEVADLFNNLTKGKAPKATRQFQEVTFGLNAHCRKRWNKWRAIFFSWRAIFVRKYLSNPWVFTSLVGAVILLVATLLQTIYTVVPFYTKN